MLPRARVVTTFHDFLIPYLFPDAPARVYVAYANEAIEARLWAGLNYRTDLERARALGEKVAQLVITQAKTDGRATKSTLRDISPAPFTSTTARSPPRRTRSPSRWRAAPK